MAKEANEDANRFKYLSALDKSTVAAIDTDRFQIDVKKDEAPQEVSATQLEVAKPQSPQKPAESAPLPPKSEQAASAGSPANATTSPAEADAKKGGKKKKSDDKVKPKCGCVIS